MMKKIPFMKCHGLGNDFILLDGLNDELPPREQWSDLAKLWCKRGVGIGADGLSFLQLSDSADVKMTIINEDGSEAQMCGNLVRCIATYFKCERGFDQPVLMIETRSGVLSMRIDAQSGEVTVDMGCPILTPSLIPTTLSGTLDQCVEARLDHGENTYAVTAVSMGNPHAVIFVPSVAAIPLDKIGPELEVHSAFPDRVNVEFVEIVSQSKALMRVWERGAGATLACGTGACAVLVAGVLTGRLARAAEIVLPGGTLSIVWDEMTNHVLMTGPATMVYRGEIAVPEFNS